MKIKIIILSLFIFTLLPLSKDLFGQPPQYVKYVLTVTISGQVINVTPGSSTQGYSNIVSGAEILVSLRYDEYFAESGNFENKAESQTVYTDSRGYYYSYFDISAEINYMTIGMDAQFIGPSDWLLKDEKLGQDASDTQYVKNFNVIALVDSDVNGIHDEFEWELLKKFCPSLTLNVPEPSLFPNPVQILGGEYNTELYVTLVFDNKIKHEFDKVHNTVPIRADLIQYAGPDMNFKNIMKPETWGERVNISNKDILNLPSNPIPLQFTGYLRTQSNYKAPYETKMVALIMDDEMLLNYDQFTPAALYVHYNLPGSTPNEWWRAYKDNPMRLKDTVYGTIWKQGSTIAIQYWFFYAYNDWKNDHEGDWEHINVLLTSQFPDQAQIDRVQFYFHTKWKEWKPSDLIIEDQTHVMVFVGGTYEPSARKSIFHAAHDGHLSNASYPYPDTWEDVGDKGNHDTANAVGMQIRWYSITNESDKSNDGFGLELIKDPNYLLNHDYFSVRNKQNYRYLWLLTDLFWGEPANKPSNGEIVAYPGPTFKAGWRTLGSVPNESSPY